MASSFNDWVGGAVPRAGRGLEQIVAHLESILAPLGASVRSPEYVMGKSSKSRQELDVAIRCMVGMHELLLMLECRDRKRPQGTDWIQQLCKKREEVGAHKVIAISTSGFTEGAKNLAEAEGIVVREAFDFEVADFFAWYGFRRVFIQEPRYDNIRLRVWTVEGWAREAALLGDQLDLWKPPDDQDVRTAGQKTLHDSSSGAALDTRLVWDAVLPKLKLPHVTCDAASGSGSIESPRSTMQIIVNPESPLEVRDINGASSAVHLLALAFDWWIISTPVSFLQAHRFVDDGERVAGILSGSFDSPSFVGNVHIAKQAGAAEGHIQFNIQVKGVGPAAPGNETTR